MQASLWGSLRKVSLSAPEEERTVVIDRPFADRGIHFSTPDGNDQGPSPALRRRFGGELHPVLLHQAEEALSS